MWRGGCIIKVGAFSHATLNLDTDSDSISLHSPSSLVTSPTLTRRTSSSSRCCSMTSSTRVRIFFASFAQNSVFGSNLVFLVFYLAIHKAQPGWRRVIAQSVLWGVPTPAFSTALAFLDGYRSEIVPANILQAQVSHGLRIFRSQHH